MPFDLLQYQQKLQETAQFLQNKFSCCPELAIIAGTGLGELIDAMHVDMTLPYDEIPHFPQATVQSHAGRLLVGRLGGRATVLFQGRFHLYEGYQPWEIVFPLRALRQCGLHEMLITNAAGGLNPDFEVGDLMLISDHINFTGVNPLRGPHNESWGPRFADMSVIYDQQLRAIARRQARKIGVLLREGIYMGVSGPSLESPAETRFFRQAGADAIGMSTVLEVIAAVQAGIRVLGISVITNVNNPDRMQATTVEEVIAAAGHAAPRLSRLSAAIAAQWPAAPSMQEDFA